MSASREKKTRQEQGSTVSPQQAKARAEAARQRRSTTIYSGVIIAALVAAVALFVWNSNIFQRSAKALEVAGETYTAADFAYHYQSAYNSFLNQSGSYASYLFDSSKSLREQDCPYNDGTWFDYFADIAARNLANHTVLNQRALADGFDDGGAVEDAVSEAVEALKGYAANNGVSLKQYLGAVYGPLMTQEVFERNVRLTERARLYSASLTYTDEQLEAAYNEDPNAYSSADFEYALFLAEQPETETPAEGEETQEPDEAETEKLLAAAKENADAALMRAQAGESLKTVATELGGNYNHVKYASSGSSDLLTWVFDDARKDGQATEIPYGEDGYYVAVYHSKSRNDYNTVSVRHILVADEAAATDLLTQWKAGEATEDSFAALAKENSTDTGSSSNGGLYTDIARGQMVTEFEDWCFDPARQSGDTGIVSTDYGYHIMYFVSRSDTPYWKEQASEALASQDIETWYNEAVGEAGPTKLDGIKYVG